MALQAWLARRRKTLAESALQSPGSIRPSQAVWRDLYAAIGDSEFVEQDESIIRDATKRLTFVHRVDHQSGSRVNEDPFFAALDFALDHLPQAAVRQLPKAKLWAQYYIYRQQHPLPPPTPRLEEMWE